MTRIGFSIYEKEGHLKVYISRNIDNRHSHRIYYPSLASTKRIENYCRTHPKNIQLEFYKNDELSIWIT